jgi:hypothetical protein
MDCHVQVTGSSIKDDVLKGKVPQCQSCLIKEKELLASRPNTRPRAKPKPKKPAKKKAANPWLDDDSDEEIPPQQKTTGLMKVCPLIRHRDVSLCSDPAGNYLLRGEIM